MTRILRLGFPLALALAAKCGDGTPPPDDSADDSADDSTVEGDADADADADTDTDSDGDADLPDLSGQMEPDYCDTQSAGHESWVGATQYYLGVLLDDGAGGWTGTETLYIWATAEWEQQGGADCVATWDLSGSRGAASGCAGCDYAISLSASLDATNTTCPASFTSGAETWSSSYDIDEHDDGTVSVYFSSSGNAFANGASAAGGLTYLSNRSCVWF